MDKGPTGFGAKRFMTGVAANIADYTPSLPALSPRFPGGLPGNVFPILSQLSDYNCSRWWLKCWETAGKVLVNLW